MDDLKQQIAALIVQALMLEEVRPEDIDTAAPLFGGALDLDSVDALEIAVEIERVFGVRIPDSGEGREVFRCVDTLAAFVAANRQPA
ncbi:MAG: acyl carrier protein [Deltaproteobacteria bacterium]|nr:acyl carrier protein [Deltaproteobacteria bacterium]